MPSPALLAAGCCCFFSRFNAARACRKAKICRTVHSLAVAIVDRRREQRVFVRAYRPFLDGHFVPSKKACDLAGADGAVKFNLNGWVLSQMRGGVQ